MRTLNFKLLTVYILLVFCNLSCSKDEQSIDPNTLCGIHDPLNNIEWLSERIGYIEAYNIEIDLYKLVWEANDYVLIDDHVGWDLFDCEGNYYCGTNYSGGNNCESTLGSKIGTGEYKDMVLIYSHAAEE